MNTGKIEKLEPNTMYHSGFMFSKSTFIFKYSDNPEDSKNCECIRFGENSHFGTGFVLSFKSYFHLLNNLRLATEDEIEWFNLCKQAGKYVPKPEPKMIEYEYF